MNRRLVYVGAMRVVRQGAADDVFYMAADFGMTERLYTHLTCGALFYVNLDALYYRLRRSSLEEFVAGETCPECGARLDVVPYPENYRCAASGTARTYSGGFPDPAERGYRQIEVWDLVPNR